MTWEKKQLYIKKKNIMAFQISLFLSILYTQES